MLRLWALLALRGSAQATDDDYGDVTDESPVEGVYNPQMQGDVLMCANGLFFFGGQCYEYCNDGTEAPLNVFDRCYDKKCPKGWSEDPTGLLCKKNGLSLNTKPKDSYKRQVQGPKTCKLGESFGPNAVADNGNRDFTVVMASDTQLPWPSCLRGLDGKNSPESRKCAIADNEKLVQAVHSLHTMTWPSGAEEQVAEPIGVFIAGDLTSLGKPWQLNDYRMIWETRKGEDRDKNMKLGVWPGLGNHDYHNNLNACEEAAVEEPFYAPYAMQSCAQRMVAYIRASVAGCGRHVVNPNFGGHVDHYEKKSAGYAVKYGRVRIVQLHNYPTFRRAELTGVASTMGFLKKQIELAEQNEEYVVLVMHDMDDHFSWHWDFKQVARHDYYSQVMQGSRVLAVFAGHLHPQGGFKDYVRDSRNRTAATAEHGGKSSEVFVRNKWGERIPAVLGWAGEYLRFLTVQFNIADCYWRFGSTSAPEGDQPVRFHEPQEEKHMMIFRLPNCTVDPNYTWSPPTTTTEAPPGEISAGWRVRLAIVYLVLIGLV